MRPVYEGLLAALAPWGAFRPQPILADPRIKPGSGATVEALMDVHVYLRSSLPLELETFWEMADGLRFDFDTLVFSTAEFPADPHFAEPHAIRRLGPWAMETYSLWEGQVRESGHVR